MPRDMHQPKRGITELVELLGLQTYGKEQEDPLAAKRRPAFRYEPLIELYWLEIPSLFGVLLRDEGTILDRDDPHLFDQELENLLAEYGPLIWPELGQGDRDHLRKPQESTLYTSDLVYPRDSAILKTHMREIILCKRSNNDIDVDALITKTQRYSKRKILRNASSTQVIPQKRQSHDINEAASSKLKRHINSGNSDGTSAEDSSEDSVLGIKTRRQTRTKGKHSPEAPFKIELRLYRKTTRIIPPSPGPVCPYGAMFLTDEWDTADDCFSRVCENIETDCSFMIFHLPEDMSLEGPIRLDRGSRDSETIFQRVLRIFKKARKFPGEPQHHFVEVEVGHDVPTDD